jgi:hypothetical protein
MGWFETPQLFRNRLLQNRRPGRSGDEAKEWWRRVQRARAELGVRLQPDEVWMFYEGNKFNC